MNPQWHKINTTFIRLEEVRAIGSPFEAESGDWIVEVFWRGVENPTAFIGKKDEVNKARDKLVGNLFILNEGEK